MSKNSRKTLQNRIRDFLIKQSNFIFSRFQFKILMISFIILASTNLVLLFTFSIMFPNMIGTFFGLIFMYFVLLMYIQVIEQLKKMGSNFMKNKVIIIKEEEKEEKREEEPIKKSSFKR